MEDSKASAAGMGPGVVATGLERCGLKVLGIRPQGLVFEGASPKPARCHSIYGQTSTQVNTSRSGSVNLCDNIYNRCGIADAG